MKIEVGREYKTRDGSVVEIVAKNDDSNTYKGRLTQSSSAKGSVYNFDADGSFSWQQNSHHLTIVEELNVFPLEVGRKYRTRDGKQVVITAKIDINQYAALGEVIGTPFKSEIWTAEGFYFKDTRDSPFNIVGYWDESIKVQETSLKPVWKKKNADGPPWGGWECVIVGENRVS